MLVAVIGRGGAEDDLHTLDPRAVVRQAAARHGGAVAAFTRLGIAPVDQAVLAEGRAGHNIQQAALPSSIDSRKAPNGLADRTGSGDDPQAARPLGHQPAAIESGTIEGAKSSAL